MKKHMSTKTICLEPYILECYQGRTSSGYLLELVFDRGITHYPPSLRSDRTNRILIYPGCFNPPHHGHLELLRHGFAKSGYNIVAAIVIPLDDNKLVSKSRAAGEDMILSKEQRVQLWRQKYYPNDWFWVYDRTEQEWEESGRLLTHRITGDGFDIEFVLLCGPDYVRLHELPPPMSWCCKDIITSDISRRADFVSWMGLRSLINCGPWKKIAPRKDIIWEDALEKTAWLCSGISLLYVQPQTIQSMFDEGKYDLVSHKS